MKNSNRKRNLAIGFGVVAAAGIAGSAFAASITTVGSNAGQGTSQTAGYNATNIGFTSLAAAGNNSAADINGIKFNMYLGTGTDTVLPTGHTVFARLNSGNWMACTLGTSPAMTCTGQTLAASAVTSVEIVAFKN